MWLWWSIYIYIYYLKHSSSYFISFFQCFFLLITVARKILSTDCRLHFLPLLPYLPTSSIICNSVFLHAPLVTTPITYVALPKYIIRTNLTKKARKPIISKNVCVKGLNCRCHRFLLLFSCLWPPLSRYHHQSFLNLLNFRIARIYAKRKSC